MTTAFTVGGTRGVFREGLATEVADLLDHAFGAEGDWEGSDPLSFGESGEGLAEFKKRAVAELGEEELPNLCLLDVEERGVYLPAPVQSLSLPFPAGGNLRCAGLHGLREELSLIAERWDLPVDDEALETLPAARLDPALAAFAKLSLAANEAVRRDCPLWLIANDSAPLLV